jgi:phage shock protein A
VARFNDVVSMDINELRGWATVVDRTVIASLVVTVLAVSALGLSTWFSFRLSSAIRAHDQAALDQYKGMEGRSVQLEQNVATVQQRMAALEQEVATAKGRTTDLQQQVTAAHDRAATMEQEAAAARQRAEAYGQAAREANERAARADREASERAARAERETAAAAAKEQALQIDAAEIRKRLEELGQQVKQAARAPKEETPAPEAPAEPVIASPPAAKPEPAPIPDKQDPPPVATGLRKYAGTNAAVFVLDQVSAAPAAAAAIATTLGEAGWTSQTWRWSGVAGIFGVVVLVKEGSGPTTDEAASTLVEQLRASGFSVTRGDWPADWRRHQGTLDGPQTPAPTEATIRIVVGIKPR